jgi:hypothetical protein
VNDKTFFETASASRTAIRIISLFCWCGKGNDATIRWINGPDQVDLRQQRLVAPMALEASRGRIKKSICGCPLRREPVQGHSPPIEWILSVDPPDPRKSVAVAVRRSLQFLPPTAYRPPPAVD